MSEGIVQYVEKNMFEILKDKWNLEKKPIAYLSCSVNIIRCIVDCITILIICGKLLFL